MILCGGSDFDKQKSPEHDFKILHRTINKIPLWNLFTYKGTCMIYWVGRKPIYLATAKSLVRKRWNFHDQQKVFSLVLSQIRTVTVSEPVQGPCTMKVRNKPLNGR